MTTQGEKRGTTMHAVRRLSEIMDPDNGMAGWLFSPPTPEKPGLVQPGADGRPPVDETTVVDCGGNLFDRIVLYRTHQHTLRIPRKLSPMLEAFFAIWWGKHETDERPENREVRALILDLAAKADGDAGADERRAWRVIDWRVRENAPVVLELAGFKEHAQAYRALPAITGPTLPRGAARVFRAACRDTDRASSEIMRRGQGQHGRPYIHAGLAWDLEWAARLTIPGLEDMLKETLKTQMTPLGLGLLASSYARYCVEWSNSTASLAARKRARAQLDAESRELMLEVIGMREAHTAAA